MTQRDRFTESEPDPENGQHPPPAHPQSAVEYVAVRVKARAAKLALRFSW
ncbi:hypothetical protein [Streptomyces sp. NPDC002889]